MPQRRSFEERAIYIALILAGLLPVVGAMIRGGAIGGGITLCLLMIVAGTIGLVSDIWRMQALRVPTVRIVKRSSRPQTR